MRRLPLLAVVILLFAAQRAGAANPGIDSVSPAVLTSSPSPQTVTLIGHDFAPGATVTLLYSQPLGSTHPVEFYTGSPIIHDVIVVSPSKITMTVQYQPTQTLNLAVSVANTPDSTPARAPLTITAALSDATPIIFNVDQIDFDFATTTVQARVTPHSTAYLVYGGHVPHAFFGVIIDGVNAVTDDDGDGVVTFPAFDHEPGFAVFFVIDSTGARHWADAPWSTPLPDANVHDNSVELGPDGSLSRIVVGGATGGIFPLLLWVRPGVGAWWSAPSDGGQDDIDIPSRSNGHINLMTSSFRILGTSPPPPHSFQSSDHLVVMHPDTGGWWSSVLPNPFNGTPGDGTIYATSTNSQEGTPSVLYLERRGGTEGSISLDYRTSNGTAVGGVNYVISSGTVTFGRGEFLKAVSIPTIDDGLYSPSLSFNVEFIPHGTSVFGDNTLQVSIGNIDPQPALSVDDVSAEEQSLTATFLVTMSRAATTPVTVHYATVDGTATAALDYTATSGILTFAPGEIAKPVTVSVVRDQIADAGETFTFRLSDATGATILKSTGTATILESDRLQQPVVLIDDLVVAEGNSGTTDATFNIRLSFASTLPVVVAWKTENGSAHDDSDYIAGIGTLTFAPGETSLPVTVKIAGDATPESNETFRLAIIGTSNAIPGTGAACTIVNDDGQPPPPRHRAAH